MVRGGDFDGDGYTDIALSGVVGWATIPVAFSNHDGTFRVTNSFVGDFAIWASSLGVSILAGDFNGDHRTDLALVGVPGWGSVPVAFSNGDGSFTITNSGIVDFASWAAVPGAAKLTGDFDGDGRTDIALTGVQGWGSVPVAFSHGDGTFGVSNYAVTGDFAIKSATQGVVRVTGDFDGDGRTDIALGGNAGWSAVPIAFSAGNGYFNVTNTQAPCQGVVGQAVLNQPGDFNGDGRTDLVLMIPSRACVLLSYGDGSFWDPYGGAIAPELEDIADNTLTWDPAFSIEATHVDSDGRTDLLVVGGPFPDAYAAVFNSNGTFAVGAIAYDIHFFGLWADSPTAVRVFGRFR